MNCESSQSARNVSEAKPERDKTQGLLLLRRLLSGAAALCLLLGLLSCKAVTLPGDERESSVETEEFRPFDPEKISWPEVIDYDIEQLIPNWPGEINDITPLSHLETIPFPDCINATYSDGIKRQFRQLRNIYANNYFDSADLALVPEECTWESEQHYDPASETAYLAYNLRVRGALRENGRALGRDGSICIPFIFNFDPAENPNRVRYTLNLMTEDDTFRNFTGSEEYSAKEMNRRYCTWLYSHFKDHYEKLDPETVEAYLNDFQMPQKFSNEEELYDYFLRETLNRIMTQKSFNEAVGIYKGRLCFFPVRLYSRSEITGTRYFWPEEITAVEDIDPEILNLSYKYLPKLKERIRDFDSTADFYIIRLDDYKHDLLEASPDALKTASELVGDYDVTVAYPMTQPEEQEGLARAKMAQYLYIPLKRDVQMRLEQYEEKALNGRERTIISVPVWNFDKPCLILCPIPGGNTSLKYPATLRFSKDNEVSIYHLDLNCPDWKYYEDALIYNPNDRRVGAALRKVYFLTKDDLIMPPKPTETAVAPESETNDGAPSEAPSAAAP